MSYPTTIDSLARPSATDTMADSGVEGDVVIDAISDAIEALETKVGIDSSAVTTSHDYKLSGVTTGDKAVSKTGTETLTNKTLTSPTINTPTITSPSITGLTADTLDEASVNSGVTVENVLLKDSEILLNNNLALNGKDSGGTSRNLIKYDSNNNLLLGDSGVTGGTWKLNPRSFVSVVMSGSQAISTATWTKLQFSTESYDLASEWNTSTYTFTALTEGLYRITAQINYSDIGGASSDVILSVYKNGSEVRRSNTPNAANYENIVVTATLQLNASETIEFYVYQSSGLTKNVNYNTLGNFAEILKVA